MARGDGAVAAAAGAGTPAGFRAPLVGRAARGERAGGPIPRGACGPLDLGRDAGGGTAVHVDLLVNGDRWVALGSVDGHRLTLRGDGFPFAEVRLVRVEIEAYVAALLT